MSILWSATEIAKITRLPPQGVVAILKAFFDDSGTHDCSKVVVWGGVVGTSEQFNSLEDEWSSLLRHPLEGKPPLKKFSLSKCRSKSQEFSNYSPAESDALQFAFRSIIVKSEVMPVVYGVDVDAWNSIVTGPIREIMGPAEGAAFGLCAKAAMGISASDGDAIAIVFDKGRMLNGNNQIYAGAEALFPEVAKRSSATYVSVEASPGLQAADIPANYFYRYAQDWIELGENAVFDPHFKHLINNIDQHHYGMMGSVEIADLTEKMRQSRGV